MTERVSWLTDASLHLEKADAFDVVGLVERLSGLIETGSPPFTISLSGPWGVGKSTVAQELKTRLGARGIPGVIVDAWTEDIEHLRRTLAILVGAQLSEHPDDLDSVAKKIDEAIRSTKSKTLPPRLNLTDGGALKSISQSLKSSAMLLCIDAALVALTVCSAIWFPAPAGAFAALLSASLIFTMFQSGLFLHIVTTSQSTAPAAESVEVAKAFKSAVTENANGTPDKVLVVVDNLDRLDGGDALRALAEIRALVEVPGSRAIFLVPIDRRALTRHIQPRIGPGGSDESQSQHEGVQAGGGEIAAADYLEKFFNLDLLLTRPDVLDLREWALQEARKILPDDDGNDLVIVVQVVCSAAAGSPRSVKRILNGVAARQRLLAPSAASSVSLAQLAFIECLATQFPELVSWLAPDGRQFMSLREEVKQGRGKAVQIPELSEARKDRLREFLLANSEINITAPMTRLAMSLREDAVWKGVSSPTVLQEALDTGQSEALDAALAALDDGEIERAVDASVSYIERSVPSFPRDAVSGLVAIGEIIAGHPSAAKRLHPLAVQAFLGSDHANRNRITRPLATLLFSDSYEHSDLQRLASSFVETLVDADSTIEVSQGLVATTTASGRFLSGQQKSAAREALAKLGDDLLAPLFESPLELWAVEGPVADMYVERLSTWEATAPDYPSLATGVDRLHRLVEAGWSSEEGLRQVAARTVGQLMALPDDSENSGFVDQLAALLRAAPVGEEVDQLAASLATLPGTVDPPARLASALRLPVREEAKPAVKNAVTEWLRSANIAASRSLVINQREDLASFGYDPIPELTKRWLALEGRQWADLAVEFDDGQDAELLPKALAGASVDHYPALAHDAASIAADRSDTQSGESLLHEMAERCSQLPADSLANLGDALDGLQQVGADLSPLATAIGARISTDPEIGQLAHSVRQLHERGIKGMRVLAVPLAARGSAAGGIQLDEIPWLIRCTNGSNDARRAAVRVIESGPVTSVCEMLNVISPGLRRHAEVNLAIARRAASASNEDEATMLLNSALGWKKPAGDERQEYRGLLTTVANRWPSEPMTDLVNRLQ